MQCFTGGAIPEKKRGGWGYKITTGIEEIVGVN